MFGILAMTGIRAGELLGLEVEDLTSSEDWIFIRRSAWQYVKNDEEQGQQSSPCRCRNLLQLFSRGTWRLGSPTPCDRFS